jgi:hypothetical protein
MRSSCHHGEWKRVIFCLPAPSVQSLLFTQELPVASVGDDKPAVGVWHFLSSTDTPWGDVHSADTRGDQYKGPHSLFQE